MRYPKAEHHQAEEGDDDSERTAIVGHPWSPLRQPTPGSGYGGQVARIYRVARHGDSVRDRNHRLCGFRSDVSVCGALNAPTGATIRDGPEDRFRPAGLP